mgnify:CR=1 FL=1
MIIGILGSDPFGGMIEETVRGETLNGRIWAQGPWHRARLVDYLNDLDGAFFPLETEGRTWSVNRDLVQSVVILGTHGQAR